MAATRSQPPWHSPAGQASDARRAKLRIYNTLTRKKNPFITIDPAGQKVTWYACGPTVYDDSHLGHARNYVTTDIIRRIMRDYFKFDVRFVMNITDVDDKIILRARQQFLLKQYKTSHPEITQEVLDFSKDAFGEYLQKNLKALEEGLRPEDFSRVATQTYREAINPASGAGGPVSDEDAKIRLHVRTAEKAATALQEASAGVPATQFYAALDDVLVLLLDKTRRSSIGASQHEIFTDLTQKFEQSFFDDFDALNVLRPDVLTRVTEYIPQIIKFIERLEEKGFAYVTQGGDVWFDIAAFEKAGNSYARLEPWNANNTELQADGEGALVNSASKKSSGDFALWKRSREGEPSWPSKWGAGRPGWHIECSAMAADVFETAQTQSVDIHSGGLDLTFPHHDNEIAQSEAYYCDGQGHQHQWVNYFLHMGQLSIAGSKMSKSLKNFTSIKEALGRGDWTPRGLRIVFLLGPWRDGIEVTQSLVKEGHAWETKLTNFFLKAINRQPGEGDTLEKTASDQVLQDAQSSVENALSDSFDTRKAMQVLSGLVTELNTADQQRQLGDSLLSSAARWITEIVTIFGLNPETERNDKDSIGWNGTDIPEAAKPFVYPLRTLRDDLRQQARSANFSAKQSHTLLSEAAAGAESVDPEAKPFADALEWSRQEVKSLSDRDAPAKDFLALCDSIRDVKLWDLGVYLEDPSADSPRQTALVRPVDAELRRLRTERESDRVAAAEAKAKRVEAEAAKQRERDEKAKVDPRDMFRGLAEYSAWDAEGLPTHDADGQEVSKAKGKKLRKEWERQAKLHEAWKKGAAPA